MFRDCSELAILTVGIINHHSFDAVVNVVAGVDFTGFLTGIVLSLLSAVVATPGGL